VRTGYINYKSVGRMDGLSVVSQWSAIGGANASTYVLCNFDASGDYYVESERYAEQ